MGSNYYKVGKPLTTLIVETETFNLLKLSFFHIALKRDTPRVLRSFTEKEKRERERGRTDESFVYYGHFMNSVFCLIM